MSWRAAASRGFIYKRFDLPLEIVSPLTAETARPFRALFDNQIFASFNQRVCRTVDQSLDEFARRACRNLSTPAKSQATRGKASVKKLVDFASEDVGKAMDEARERTTLRNLAPQVLEDLKVPALFAVQNYRGKGSFAKQKARVDSCFHSQNADRSAALFP